MSAKKMLLLFILMLTIFLATIWAIFYYDIGGTQRYARNIPIISSLMPKNANIDMATIEEELNSYSHNKLLKYTLNLYKQNEVNKEEIEALKAEVVKWGGEDGAIIKGKYEELSGELDKALDEVVRLREYEDAYVKLKKEKEYQDKVMGMDNIETYKTYFEGLYPDQANQIYELVIGQEKVDQDFENYVASFAGMEPKKAGLVIEQLMRTDFDVVVTIMRKLDTEVAASILNNIDTSYASMITRNLANKKVEIE